ncbi:unnamed protein product [Moneuplotes crassus]|uniref:Uncharacterized protein n=1 Tax=Euplotes crassus TaxID=5936 RepID=A0AAD1U2N1_EUPCR|nr:unnamed protein product [Moneuplotes crassus]
MKYYGYANEVCHLLKVLNLQKVYFGESGKDLDDQQKITRSNFFETMFLRFCEKKLIKVRDIISSASLYVLALDNLKYYKLDIELCDEQSLEDFLQFCKYCLHLENGGKLDFISMKEKEFSELPPSERYYNKKHIYDLYKSDETDYNPYRESIADIPLPPVYLGEKEKQDTEETQKDFIEFESIEQEQFYQQFYTKKPNQEQYRHYNDYYDEDDDIYYDYASRNPEQLFELLDEDKYHSDEIPYFQSIDNKYDDTWYHENWYNNKWFNNIRENYREKDQESFKQSEKIPEGKPWYLQNKFNYLDLKNRNFGDNSENSKKSCYVSENTHKAQRIRVPFLNINSLRINYASTPLMKYMKKIKPELFEYPFNRIICLARRNFGRILGEFNVAKSAKPIHHHLHNLRTMKNCAHKRSIFYKLKIQLSNREDYRSRVGNLMCSFKRVDLVPMRGFKLPDLIDEMCQNPLVFDHCQKLCINLTKDSREGKEVEEFFSKLFFGMGETFASKLRGIFISCSTDISCRFISGLEEVFKVLEGRKLANFKQDHPDFKDLCFNFFGTHIFGSVDECYSRNICSTRGFFREFIFKVKNFLEVMLCYSDRKVTFKISFEGTSSFKATHLILTGDEGYHFRNVEYLKFDNITSIEQTSSPQTIPSDSVLPRRRRSNLGCVIPDFLGACLVVRTLSNNTVNVRKLLYP